MYIQKCKNELNIIKPVRCLKNIVKLASVAELTSVEEDVAVKTMG